MHRQQTLGAPTPDPMHPPTLMHRPRQPVHRPLKTRAELHTRTPAPHPDAPSKTPMHRKSVRLTPHSRPPTTVNADSPGYSTGFDALASPASASEDLTGIVALRPGEEALLGVAVVRFDRGPRRILTPGE
jgi:hypothetical protein